MSISNSYLKIHRELGKIDSESLRIESKMKKFFAKRDGDSAVVTGGCF